jgi:hypothetical protein
VIPQSGRAISLVKVRVGQQITERFRPADCQPADNQPEAESVYTEKNSRFGQGSGGEAVDTSEASRIPCATPNRRKPKMTTDVYPVAAGHKENHGTSQIAARQVDADPDRKLRIQTEAAILITLNPDMTADDVAAELGESVLYVRPRISELVALNVLVKTNRKRPSLACGRSAAIMIASGDLLDHIARCDPEGIEDFRIVVRGFIQSRIIQERAALRLSRRGHCSA